jgi:2-polyprenyl-3-methyl-5-hydroxy-6-metoxy-1,4-benzoquinol methylase
MAASGFFRSGAKTGLVEFFNKGNRLQLINPVITQAKLLQTRLKRPLRILDIGCGPGMHANYFAELGHHVTAVDPEEEMIAQGKKHFANPNLVFVCDALPTLGKLTSRYDVIYSVGVWQYLEPKDRQAAMNRVTELTMPGGVIGTIWPVPRSRDHQHILTHEDIHQTVVAANTKRSADQAITLTQGGPIRDPDERKGFIEKNEDVFFHTTLASLPALRMSETLDHRTAVSTVSRP